MLPWSVSGTAAHPNANIGPAYEPFPYMDVWLREPFSSAEGRTGRIELQCTAREDYPIPARPQPPA